MVRIIPAEVEFLLTGNQFVILLLSCLLHRMGDHMKTELVSAIHLQEVELREKPAETKSRWSNAPIAVLFLLTPVCQEPRSTETQPLAPS